MAHRTILTETEGEARVRRYGRHIRRAEGVMTHPTSVDGPEEWGRIVFGTAKSDFVCDQTGTAIPAGERCAAFTAWQPGQMGPLMGWESDFIEPDPEGEE